MDIGQVLTAQAERTSSLVRSVGPDQLGLTTPCAGWDVRALINHLCLASQFAARVAAGERALPDYETDFVGDAPAGAYDRWKDAMVEACTAPGLVERTVHLPGADAPGAVILALALMDTVVHRWDLARALGVDADIPDEIATALLSQLESIIPDAMRAGAPDQATAAIPFGPRVEVSADATPVERLVAFLGRTP